MTYSLKNDTWIIKQSTSQSNQMITPFQPELISSVTYNNQNIKLISYGTTSFGYDIRLGTEFRLFKLKHTNNNRLLHTDNYVTEQSDIILDPKNFHDVSEILLPITDKVSGEVYVILPPYSFALGTSIEYVKIPDNVFVLLVCKSSMARVGININTTTIQPSFEGNITIEFTNSTPYSVKLYCNEGCGNLVFFEGSTPKNTYQGKYQKQKGVTLVR